MSESDIERIQRLQGELEATDRNHVGTDVYALAILSNAVLEVALQLAKSRGEDYERGTTKTRDDSKPSSQGNDKAIESSELKPSPKRTGAPR